MSIFLSVLKVLLAIAVAVAINYQLYVYTVTDRDYNIRRDLAESGINITDYEMRQGLLILELPAADEEVDETDIMLIRKTLDALRNANFRYSEYYIKLIAPSGKTIYSDKYTNILKINNKYTAAVPESTVDNSTYMYMMKYFFAENDIKMTAFNFYETIGLDSDALYIEIECEKSTLSEAVEKTVKKIADLNNNGALVLRYSIVFKNSAGESLCAISIDEYYNDTIYWKAPSCVGIKTVYDGE